MNRDFVLDLGGRRVKAKLTDLSVDGLGIFVEGISDIAVSSLDISIREIDLKASGKIVWSRNQLSGISLGIHLADPLKGDIRNCRLADMLIGIQKLGKSGILQIETPVSIQSIYFRQGNVIFASSENEDKDLAEIFLDTGKINLDQYRESLEQIAKSGKNQGALLVELGYIRPEDLIWAVRRQAERVILGLFALEQGRFVFREESLSGHKLVSLSFNTGDLIYRGAKSIEDPGKIRAVFPKGEALVSFNAEAHDFLAGIRLGDQEKKIIQFMDGVKTMNEILSLSPLSEHETLKTLYALYNAQIMEVTDAEEKSLPSAEEERAAQEGNEAQHAVDKVETLYREYKSLGYYGVLNVGRNASVEEIKRSYYSRAKEFHPDRYLHFHSDSLKAKVHVIFSYINEAYRTLTAATYTQQPEIKPGFEKEGQRKEKMARQKFEEGKRSFERDDFEQSLILLGQAAYLDDTIADYHYYYGLALLQNKKIRDAETSIRRAMQLDPYNADYITYLGYLYLQLGFQARAKNAFEKALKYSPSNQRASEGLKKSMP